MTDVFTANAVLMDRIYRRQRHFYDASRKYFLLGRDRLIARLGAPEGGHVLEIGCGTGRNLVYAARAWPDTAFYGLDISREMLASAEGALARARLTARTALGQGDAAAFDAEALFARARFHRVFLSYSLSMIPGWRAALDHALGLVAPGGSLHIVDFGRQERLPRFFRRGLRSWLARFHVAPRDELEDALNELAAARGADVLYESLFGGYAVRAVVTMPA